MPRPIELELDLGQHYFEETVLGSVSSDEDDSDDNGSEPTNARCVEDDARAAVARRVQLEAANKARELEPVRVAGKLRKAEEARLVEEARLAEKAHRKVSTEGVWGGISLAMLTREKKGEALPTSKRGKARAFPLSELASLDCIVACCCFFVRCWCYFLSLLG
jgi:hypothetical protein